jgi:5'-methylthioadenosine phosphorylase
MVDAVLGVIGGSGSVRRLDNALITQPEARDPALMKKLGAVAGRVLKGVG